MSATDPIVSKHNTALIETHSLLLVPGSAREYEHHRQEIRGASAPVGETFAVACGSIGAILLAVGGSLWGYEALAGIRFPLVTQAAPYAIYASLALLGVKGFVLAVNVRRESLRESRLKALDASLGIQAFSLASAVPLDTHARKAVLAGVLDGVTPDVRDRLLRLVGQGKRGSLRRRCPSFWLRPSGSRGANRRGRQGRHWSRGGRRHGERWGGGVDLL